MRLHDLKPRPGSRHRRKRLGQGESSGHGKTSGRGGKGQTARSGSSIRIGFEGGQMPLIRRIPKRGFNNKAFAVRYIPVNLESLNLFDDGATVDDTALRSIGLANGTGKRIKILGSGELTRKLTVSAHAFSTSARAKIEKLGGACNVILFPLEEKAAKLAAAKKAAKPAKKQAEAKPVDAKPAETK
jgi:large subunit ribosomal protein L15